MKPQMTLLAIAVLLGSSSFCPLAQAGSFEISPFQMVQGQEPVAPQHTYMTPKSNNQIAVQITDGEFNFRGVLTRSSGNTYIAQDRQVRVMYDREVGRVVVINVVTGKEFYNYPYRDNQRNTSEGAL
uniref:MSHA biogenesis protein MshK n=1 Tax=Cyanothece sp. (strain PCC 7425 / ATCC 29141) TaxID=395961 RepID=B8HZH4_CYAP4